MARVHLREAARRDLVVHFVHIAEAAGIGLADRFLASAELTFQELAQMPLMGAEVPQREPLPSGMRKWRVRKFENYLIFYLTSPAGIEVVRVLHGSRDWAGLLGL